MEEQERNDEIHVVEPMDQMELRGVAKAAQFVRRNKWWFIGGAAAAVVGVGYYVATGMMIGDGEVIDIGDITPTE